MAKQWQCGLMAFCASTSTLLTTKNNTANSILILDAHALHHPSFASVIRMLNPTKMASLLWLNFMGAYVSLPVSLLDGRGTASLATRWLILTSTLNWPCALWSSPDSTYSWSQSKPYSANQPSAYSEVSTSWYSRNRHMERNAGKSLEWSTLEFSRCYQNQAHCNEFWSTLMMCIEQSFRQACVSVQADFSQPRNFNYRNSRFRPKASDPKAVTMSWQGRPNTPRGFYLPLVFDNFVMFLPDSENFDSMNSEVNITHKKNISYISARMWLTYLIHQSISKFSMWKNWSAIFPMSNKSHEEINGNDIISSQIHFNDDEASQSMPEALNKLRCYWRSVWDTRQHSNTDSIQKCREALGAPTPAAQWEPIAAAELCTAAAASGQTGKAAGLDGFSGTEVSYLPLKFCERSGLIPEAWNHIKQVHLPKPNKGKRIRDGATDVATRRPICIMSVWFRIHASTRFKSTSVQGWLDTWWPAEAFGGRCGKSIDDSLLQAQYHAEQRKYIGAFDSSLAFDMVVGARMAWHMVACWSFWWSLRQIHWWFTFASPVSCWAKKIYWCFWFFTCLWYGWSKNCLGNL